MKLEKSFEKMWKECRKKETEGGKDLRIRRQALRCMLGTKGKRLSFVQGAHRILSWVGRRQIADKHVHLGDTRVGTGSCWEGVSTERVSSVKRGREQVDNGWRGKLGGSSPQELHKQLPGSIAFRSKFVISGITDCETT